MMGEVSDSKDTTTSNGPTVNPKRVCCSRDQLETLSRDEIIERWLKQDLYIDSVEMQLAAVQSNHAALEEKLRISQGEGHRRESLLLMKLNSKEQEIQDLIVQVQELKMSQVTSESSLRCALLDPAVNVVIQRLRQELERTKSTLEETQNELSAWKFTPDSNTGKRLMAKCRLLYQENEELGRIISVGRLAKLEGDLALQRNFSEEMKKSQSELDEFLQELDEDVEGMQSTIYYLQQQLRQAREQLTETRQENEILRRNGGKLLDGTSNHQSPFQGDLARDENVPGSKGIMTADDEVNDTGPTLSKQKLPIGDSERNSHRSESPRASNDARVVVRQVANDEDSQNRTSITEERTSDETNRYDCTAASDSDRTQVSDSESKTEASDKCRKRTASQNDGDSDSSLVRTSELPACGNEGSTPPANKRFRRESNSDSCRVANGDASSDGSIHQKT